jgi:hypothetical protein
MSEVALVAAITGGATVLTSGVTAAVTWAVSRNSTAVELAKVAAENERLQQSNQEEERRNRQSTYHQFLDAVTALYQSFAFAVTIPKSPSFRRDMDICFQGWSFSDRPQFETPPSL